MPFCPVCKFEYVEGVERCSDCDSMLVEELPKEEKPVSQTSVEDRKPAVTPQKNDMVAAEPSVNCLRCNTALKCLGIKDFREATIGGALFGELFCGDSESFKLYACPRCGHVEFFLVK